MNDWFERWFGAEYLALYPHRDEEDARAMVALVQQIMHGKTVDRILDLACGSGRHARTLSELAWTVGIDLSMTLLEVAMREGPHDPYVRGDMRELPFDQGSFGLTVNLFTSFGYFDADADNEAVIAEVSRVTRKGGTFVLDYLNSVQIRDTLVSEDEFSVGSRQVQIRRGISSDDRFVEKRISVDGRTEPYLERVRLFTVTDLTEMLKRNGLVVTQTYGDYTGGTVSNTSPRVILCAERV